MAASPEIPVGPDSVFIQDTEPNELKIMSYNVLNLFDASKDEGKDDWLWLPKNSPGKQKHCSQIPDDRERNYCGDFDWTYEKVDLKLNQLKKVIHFQGSLPDMLAVVEVENANVLGLLAKKLGYENYVITDSPDMRGIDVGLLFNTNAHLKFLKWKTILIKVKSSHPTRDILRADFKWNNSLLSIYVNHWPSQRNPTEDRIAVARALAQDIDQQQTQYGSRWSAIALGDFNTIEQESPNPINDVILNSKWSNSLVDAGIYARESNQNPALPYMPPGSYYFIKDDVWNDFDRILVTKDIMNPKGIEFVQDSYRILFPEFMSFVKRRFDNNPSKGKQGHRTSPLPSPQVSPQISSQVSPQISSQLSNQPYSDLHSSSEEPSNGSRMIRVPNRYNFDTTNESQRGYSDHLPVVFKIRQ